MVLVIANVMIEGYTTRRTVKVPKDWSPALIFEVVAKALGDRNFRLGYSFTEISVG